MGEKMRFSEENTTGPILPTQRNPQVSYIAALSEVRRLKSSETWPLGKTPPNILIKFKKIVKN